MTTGSQADTAPLAPPAQNQLLTVTINSDILPPTVRRRQRLERRLRHQPAPRADRNRAPKRLLLRAAGAAPASPGSGPGREVRRRAPDEAAGDPHAQDPGLEAGPDPRAFREAEPDRAPSPGREVGEGREGRGAHGPRRATPVPLGPPPCA